MECLVCRHEIQPSDAACPQCGFPVSEQDTLTAPMPAVKARPQVDRRLLIAVGAGVGTFGILALVVGVLVGRLSAAPAPIPSRTLAAVPQSIALPAPPGAKPPPPAPVVTKVLNQPARQEHIVWDKDGDGWADPPPRPVYTPPDPVAPSHPLLVMHQSRARRATTVTIQPLGYNTQVTEMARNP
jgi:hypothetical protein